MTQRSYPKPPGLLPNRAPEWLTERRARRTGRKRVARGLTARAPDPDAKLPAPKPRVRYLYDNPRRQLRREWDAAMRAQGMATTILGLATVGYNIKRKSWRPDLTVVRPGSDPDDPLMQSLGGTEYHVHAPAYVEKPQPRTATAVPAVDDSGKLPPP